MSQDELKRAAAYAAVANEVQSGMKLGLGTGSTIAFVLDALGEALRGGRLKELVGVPTSERTAQRATELGIPLLELHEAGELDVVIDGADEVDPNLDLIKGLGGALLREKMVAQAARRFVVVADEGKRVQQLGEKTPLPIEVVQFGWQSHLPFLESASARPVLRVDAVSNPSITDNGNYILDCHFDDPEGISDPQVLDWLLLARAGIVGHGLFLDMASSAYIAGAGGVTVLNRDL